VDLVIRFSFSMRVTSWKNIPQIRPAVTAVRLLDTMAMPLTAEVTLAADPP
jgi:hypothetical protein